MRHWATLLVAAAWVGVLGGCGGRDEVPGLPSAEAGFAWGNNQFGRLGDGALLMTATPVQVVGEGGPGFLVEIDAIAASHSHSIALDSHGGVWSWGNNERGQLGDGSTLDRGAPARVVSPDGEGLLGDITVIAAGGISTYAVDPLGQVWAWGMNNYGQLGDGVDGDGSSQAENRSRPVQVVGMDGEGVLSGVVSIAAGGGHVLAVDEDHHVWAWGRNDSGQLGDDSIVTRGTPLRVVGPGGVELLSGINTVAAGGTHSIALKDDGTVWAWGSNVFGQLGDGTASPSSTPVQVVGEDGEGVLAGIVAIAAGGRSSYALHSDGTVWAWGNDDSSTPAQVAGPGGSGLLSGITAIAAIESHMLAVDADGLVWAWGSNSRGQLGDGTTYDSLTPVQVVGPGGEGWLTGVSAVAGGTWHSLALNDGAVWAWGYNDKCQLGDGSANMRNVPVRLVGEEGEGFLTDIAELSAGSVHSLALKSDGTVWAWGRNFHGQLGDGSNDDTSVPVQVVGVDGEGFLNGVVAISSGAAHSLALKGDGTVWAWGRNNSGQLGDDSDSSSSNMPVQVVGAGGEGVLVGIVAINAGDNHSLALKDDGTIWAWGNNSSGRLGNGNQTQQGSPVQSISFDQAFADSNFVAIAAGSQSSYAVTSGGAVWAWGSNGKGQLGDGTGATNRLMPVQVVAPEGSEGFMSGVTAISAGGFSAFALRSDGTVWAWGHNNRGQLGDGAGGNGTDDNNRNRPVQVKGENGAGFLTGIVAVSGGTAFSVALKADGTVWAWGQNDSGQLGDGLGGDGTHGNNTSVPVQVLGVGGEGFLSEVTRIAAAGNGHAFAW